MEFSDGHSDFRPLLSPAECIRAGIFGGCYFNKSGGKPGIFGREVEIDSKEFPEEWFEGVPEALFNSRRYNVPTNKHKVKSGQDQVRMPGVWTQPLPILTTKAQAFWEGKGWIHAQDPRGWFQVRVSCRDHPPAPLTCFAFVLRAVVLPVRAGAAHGGRRAPDQALGCVRRSEGPLAEPALRQGVQRQRSAQRRASLARDAADAAALGIRADRGGLRGLAQRQAPAREEMSRGRFSIHRRLRESAVYTMDQGPSHPPENCS
jgi:hypothetical protein